MARNCQSKKEVGIQMHKKVGKQFSSNIFSAVGQTFHAFFDVSPLYKCKNNKEKWRRNI